MASLPLRFSSSSWRACLKGSLKKFFLSFSFHFLRLLIHSARRSLASLCLRSSHNSLGLLFSLGLLSSTSSWGDACLIWATQCVFPSVLSVLGLWFVWIYTLQTSLCTPRIWCFPSGLACAQPFLAKNVAALHWGAHRACTKPLAYSPLATWPWCTFLDACVDFLVVWLVRGQCASRSHGLPPLLLHLLRLPSQHCRVYGLLPGFGSLPSDLPKQCDCAVWASSHTSSSLDVSASLWVMSPSATRMCTSRGTSHCHYPFRSLPCDPSK